MPAGFFLTSFYCLKDQMEPEVTFYSITVLSEGHNENITISTLTENQPRVLFTLKENSSYRLQLRFSVQHNIVSGLAYSNTVWKGGVRGMSSFVYDVVH